LPTAVLPEPATPIKTAALGEGEGMIRCSLEIAFLRAICRAAA
jgi:hypothetical protein